jgi:hypothetical protein
VFAIGQDSPTLRTAFDSFHLQRGVLAQSLLNPLLDVSGAVVKEIVGNNLLRRHIVAQPRSNPKIHDRPPAIRMCSRDKLPGGLT